MVIEVRLQVVNRDGCPHREAPSGGWGPQVPTCNHPNQKTDPEADYWCPDGPDQRDDDPTPSKTPFPPGCPLRERELIRRP